MNSDAYTDSVLYDYFNKLRDIFSKIEKVELNIENLCDLDYYTKVIMSINYEFKTNIQYKYDCKLVSLTVKEGCKSNTYDKETGCFDRIAPGEYDKYSLKFNVLKSDVQSVKIKNKEGFAEILSVKKFEKKYGDLKWFIFKELYENDSLLINDCDDVIMKVFEIVRPFVSLRNIPLVKYTDNLRNKRANGEYFGGTILVKNKLKYSTKEEILTHELGHFVHDIIFNDKQIRFPTKDKSVYAKKNYLENFAECFTDLVYSGDINDRTMKMFKLMQDII